MALGQISILSALLPLPHRGNAGGAIGIWYDADIDALMEGLAERAVPTGKVLPETALYLGVWVSIVSALVMGLALIDGGASACIAITMSYLTGG